MSTLDIRDAGRARSADRFLEPEVVQRLLKLSDFFVLFFGTVMLFMQSSLQLPTDTATTMTFVNLVMVFATLLGLRGLGAYRIASLVKPLRGTVMAILFSSLVGVTVFMIMRALFFDLPVMWLLGWICLPALHFAVSRLCIASWLKPKVESGLLRQRVVIVGGGKAAEEAITLLEKSPEQDIEIIGLFDDRDEQRSPSSVLAHSKLGTISELASFARNNRVDLIVVAIPMSAEDRLLHVLRRLWELPVDIRISGQATKLKFAPSAYEYLGELPMLSVFNRPLPGWDSILKSVMDRVIAVLALIALSPVMVATAIAIRLESAGPIIFKQKRYGFNNELVEVWKFRSMFTDMSDANATKLVTRDDPRVTRVGQFIRKTSIDELPQLFNVLMGTLSLVGPRPHATQAKAATELYEQVVDGYFARHKVKPGITGWAQINGWRGETDTHDKIANRVKFDLEYIDQWTLWLDLRILIRTPFALISPNNSANAY
ncbi:MAG: undecaprenyl-phosphate glucose phosphotransferase [Anderseniella sp.]